MVDAVDSKSTSERSGGSSPSQGTNINNSMKYIVLLSLFFLTSCASSVGPVEYDPDDPWFIIPLLFIVAMLFFVCKGYIEYLFAKRLEKYKKKLEINSK